MHLRIGCHSNEIMSTIVNSCVPQTTPPDNSLLTITLTLALLELWLRMSDHVQAITHDLLVRELCKVTEWDVLGFYLGLDESEITEIEHDHQSNARRRIAMLAKWMEKDVNASWEKVIDALECLSQIRLANQLKEKYCTSETNPPTIDVGSKQAESSPEKELIVRRQELIVCEIEELEEKYLLLVTSVHSAMLETNPSLMKLQMFSRFYMKTKVTTVEELFDSLEPFYFLDCALLEKIVKFFLSRDTVADDLRDYLQQLAKFKTSTTIKQFMESIEQAQQSHSTTSGLCTVIIRLVGGWLEKTMDDVEKLVNEIFQDKRYVLAHLKIVRGSVIVTFSAPLSEAESLIVLLLEQSSFALQVGVSQLVVADTVITQSESSDFSFVSSLLNSVKDNDLNLLNFLLSINTNPNAADQSNQTALHVASELNHDKSMILLLQANASPNLQDNEGRTPLYIASREGHIQIVALLLKNNANPDLPRDNGCTPLYIASQNGHTDVVAILLKNNANPDLPRDNGCTPLYIASQNGHTDVVAILLKNNANPVLPKDNGCTPLYIASQNGHTDVVAILLKNNANPNLPRNCGSTPLFIASQNGHTDIVAILLKNNANPDIQETEGCTPLFFASHNGHTDVVAILLKNNANPDLQETEGCTPLYIASQEGHIDVVAILLKSNANPDLPRDNGCTPLFIASQNGHTDVVAILLKNNANPDRPEGNGCTPLCIASQEGHTDVVSLLLKANADTGLGNKGTPLAVAALKNHTQIVQLLLDNGADPNIIKSSGFTAIMYASRTGCLKSVEILLNSGADPSIVGPKGLTALDMAATTGHEDIVVLLQSMEPSTTSPVLTANEIASNVDNETLAFINRAMEQLLVEKTETLITTEYQKLKKTDLPSKEYREESHNIFLQ